MPKLHELQERRASVVTEMRGINETAEREKRDYTSAEDARHKELKTEIAGLDRQIERARDLQEAERVAPAILHSGRLGDGKYEERARQFSLVKAINARLGDTDIDAAFEREISSEVVRRSGRKFNGIPCPDEYFHVERRTLVVDTGSPLGSAAPLYPTTLRPDLFIDMLRAQIIVGRLGATILDGLVGTIEIPKQTSSSTAQWLSEDQALSETDASFTDVPLSPKTVGAVTSYSRRTLINALPSIENVVRNDLASIVANAIDKAALIGDGSGNTPTGVRNQTSVNNLTLATPSWSEVLAFPATIQGFNADVGTFGWAMGPASVAKLRATAKTSGQPYGFLMDTPTNLIGYPVATSTVLDASDSPDVNTVLFGVWSQLLVGYWSGVDILPNPYDSTSYLRGRVMLRVMRDCDIAVRHAEAFAFGEDIPA